MINTKKLFIMFAAVVMLTAGAVICTAQDRIDSLDTIVPTGIYTDADNIARYAVFHTGDGALPEDLTVSAGGIVFDITCEKQSGMLYQPMENDVLLSQSAVDITLYSGKDSYTFNSIPVIKIVEGNAEDWTAEDNGHRLVYYTGSESDIVVPNFLNGIPVVSVGGGTVTSGESRRYVNIVNGNASALTSVKISEGILSVYPCAFYNESRLKTAALPSTLENIRQTAFALSPLTGTLDLPKGLKTIDKYAFYGCSKLTGSLTIPKGVKTVGNAAFYNCTGFNGALVLENGVEEVGELSFGGSSASMNFTSLTLSNTLKKIGCYAFQMCSKVNNELILPEGLETISDGAFDHMSAISNEVLVIPSTVKTIGGDYTVTENTGYSAHVFYDMGTNAKFRRFEVAEGNTEFTAVDGVLYSADMTRMIGYPRGKTDEVFNMPDTVTQIDELAFSRAAYLKTLVLPDSYIIDTTVPENVLNHDGNSLAVGLYVYTSIENIEVNDTNPNYTSIDGLLYSNDGKTLMYVPNNHKGDIKIAEGCETIEKGAFYAVPGNIGWEEISLPATLSEVNEYSAEIINTCVEKKAATTLKLSENGEYAINGSGYLTGPYAKGDTDISGTVDNADIVLILRYTLGLKPDNFNLSQADMNGDGKADTIDAAMLANYIG